MKCSQCGYQTHGTKGEMSARMLSHWRKSHPRILAERRAAGRAKAARKRSVSQGVSSQKGSGMKEAEVAEVIYLAIRRELDIHEKMYHKG